MNITSNYYLLFLYYFYCLYIFIIRNSRKLISASLLVYRHVKHFTTVLHHFIIKLLITWELQKIIVAILDVEFLKPETDLDWRQNHTICVCEVMLLEHVQNGTWYCLAEITIGFSGNERLDDEIRRSKLMVHLAENGNQSNIKKGFIM